jgi:hypothetical protein
MIAVTAGPGNPMSAKDVAGIVCPAACDRRHIRCHGKTLIGFPPLEEEEPMRPLLFSLCLLATTSWAAALPISGRYCGDGLDISAKGVGGEDFFCSFITKTSIRCAYSDPSFGEPWVKTISLKERNGTLTYTDADGTVILKRCD